MRWFDIHLDLTALRLQSAPFRLTQYISQNLVTWTKEIILPEIVSAADTIGHGDNYSRHLSVVQTGPLSVDIILDWQINDKPVGVWFEKGTKAHFIEAVFANLLHWIDKLTKQHRFARRVYHPGTKAHHFMERGYHRGARKLMLKITDETNAFLQRSRMA